jgi:hypothetical protein
MLYRLPCLLFVVLFCCAQSFAQPHLTDQEISKFLLNGSILDPPDSSDYIYAPSNEVFYPDGTYKLFTYTDRTCTKVKEETSARWRVQDKVLISTLADGSTLRDEVLAIKGDRITFHSLDDSQTYVRRRTPGC